MKKSIFKKISIRLILLALIAVMALSLASCKNTGSTSSEGAESTPAEASTVGQGDVSFNFSAFDKDGNEAKFIVLTSKAVVGEALLDAGLIAGDEGQYGLYVKTVNGITLDYNVDGMYWAFYVDGEYAMGGVDTTSIEAGVSYSFKASR